MKIENQKLSDAVKSIILSDPFFAAMLLQQRFVADASLPTCAVDGEAFLFNPSFCDSLSFDEVKGVIAHEAMHLVGGHHWRGIGKDHTDWNRATDYAINGLLVARGYKLPKGALLDSKFSAMSAEDIYRTLRVERQEREQEQQQGNQQQQGQQQQGQQGQQQQGAQGDDQQDGDEPSFGEVRQQQGKDAKQVEAESIAQIVKAQSIAKGQGNLSAGVMLEVEKAKQGSIDWRSILHRFFSEVTSSDYSYARLNRSYMNRGLVFPTLQSRSAGQVVLVCDTSGSTLDEMGKMVEEIQSCIDQYLSDGYAKPLRVIYADSEVCGVEDLLAGDKPSPKGGGGTDFAPAFDWIEANGGLGEASAVVYLTDGDCDSFPKLSPSYPVLWALVRDNSRFQPPFGEVVKVNLID